jgi:hypothetical protein
MIPFVFFIIEGLSTMKYVRSVLALAVVAALSLNVAFACGDKCKDKDCCKTKTEKTSSANAGDKASGEKTSKKSAKSSTKSNEAKKS